MQILGSNYGFRYNQAPVVTDGEALTHEDLSVEIPLVDLANDPEGDKPYGMASQRTFFRATDVENGTVTFSPDGQTAIFKPEVGYTGTASFELFADDGYAVSEASIVEINVSDAPLTSLDFVERNLGLEIGSQTELQVIADFADQEDVIVPGDYVSWSSDTSEVATISDRGVMTGVNNGTTIFTAERDGLNAVTVSRVGQADSPSTEAELNTAIAEYYGLDVYPDAVTLTEGEAEVTVIHGGTETVIPVNIETPNIGATELNADGGIVENSNGYQVMIPEGALAEATEVNITSLEQSELDTPLPEQFKVIDAFNLSLNDVELEVPAQLAIPAPEGLEPGTEVFFMRDGELPDETGTWNPIWFVQESGIVGDDGMIRTSSPPWPAVEEGGDYIVSVPKFEYRVGKAYGAFNTLTGIDNSAGTAALSAGVAIGGFNFGGIVSIPFFYTEVARTVEVITIPKISTLPFKTSTGVELNPNGIPTANVILEDPSSIITNDPYEPPILEEARFDFNEIDNVNQPIVYLTGSNFLVDTTVPLVPITLGEEVVFGGDNFEDLSATFYYGQDLEDGGSGFYEGEIIPSLSRSLGNNRYEIAVKVPQTVALGNSSIELTRKQTQLKSIFPLELETVQYNSDTDINIKPSNVELTLAVQAFDDKVLAFNALSEERALNEGETTVEDILDGSNTTSRDLLLARIPVGTGGNFDDDPRGLIATKDATRAYVSLRQSGQIAVLDLMSLQQVDTLPETAVVDPIQLPNNASPYAIALSLDDRYAYIGDYDRGTVYILDINLQSDTYHQVVKTISLDEANNGIRSLAVSGDGKKLFATAPGSYSQSSTGKVYTVNIDPEDEPGVDESGNPEPNDRNWHELIGSIEVEKGVEGITTTPDPNVMLFTNRFHDFEGLGRIRITNEDPTDFAADVSYTSLGLGSAQDYFDVNDARDVVVTSDGKYAFVAGFNGRNFGSGAPSIDGPKSGSNVGIIVNPLEDNAKLVAATRPIPMGLTSDITISSDDKYLFASYPGVGGVYAWSVEEMIATIEDPTSYTIDHRGYGIAAPVFNSNTARNATSGDLSSVPIDNINPDITIASDLQVIEDRMRFNSFEFVNDVEFGVPDDSTRAPLTVGANPWSITNASYRDWLRLEEEQWKEIQYSATSDDEGNLTIEPTWLDSSNANVPIPPTSLDETVTTLQLQSLPELESLFVPTGEPAPIPIPKKPLPGTGLLIGVGLAVLTWIIATSDVVEVELNISTFPSGEGLFSEEDGFVQRPPAEGIQENDLKTTENGVDDYNPNRVYSAKWISAGPGNDKGRWLVNGELIDVLLPATVFPFAHLLNLTAGQKYYYGVRAKSQTKGWETENGGEFTLPLADIEGRQDIDGIPLPGSPTAYSSVTFITPEASAFDSQGLTKANAIAQKIVTNIEGDVDGEETVDGTVLKYNPETGNWDNLNDGDRGLGKPLVLIADWSQDSVAKNYNSGFAEGAADSLFASLVAENSIFEGVEEDALFDSPFHFIGMGRGAVVNSEIIQRLGTFYPKPQEPNNPEDPNYLNRNKFPDLQMTTVDPNDFEQSNLPGLPLNNYFDPTIHVWDNVTFADNYYQTASSRNPRGRHIVNTIPEYLLPPDSNNFFNEPDLSVALGGYFYADGQGDGELYERSRVGFTPDTFEQPGDGKNPHNRTDTWYGGTVNVGWNTDNNPFDAAIHRRKGDFSHSELNPDPNYLNPWYTPTHIPDFQIGDEDAQWEGIGTGWYYSPQGGGYNRRALTLDSPQSVTIFENPSRTPVEYDNTAEARQRGDFAIPTLFNGNFDAINTINNLNQPIPGWSLHQGTNVSSTSTISNQNALVDWSDIPSLSEDRIVVDYQKNNGKRIDRNGEVINDLNLLSLTNSLLDIGYREENGKLITPNGTAVEGFEFDLLLNELIDIGYTIDDDNNLRYPNSHPSKPSQVVIGINTKELAAELGYTVDGNDSLIDNNGDKVLNVFTRGSLRRKLAIPIKESYFDRLGLNQNTYINYALQLDGGDKITHNRFVVPDWGDLRFDLHVPDVEIFTPGIEYPDLKVFMKSNEPDAQEYELSSRVIAKAGVSRTGQRIKGVEIAFDDDFANPDYAENRIGFGSAGFETFNLDIPDELRGKVSTLRFELEDYDDEVYLDNVFFQSQHLQFGNPTDARIQYDPYPVDGLTEVHTDNRENFLVEKPQYTISYNDTTKNPNWVSWQLNRSWLGAETRTNKFEQDHTLPSNWDKVQGDGDINGNPDIVPGRPDLSGEFYDRGHLAPSGDRTRNEKDNYATFLMSNMVPQSPLNNRLEEWWLGLENYSRNLVQRGKELYITAGGYNNADDFSSILRSPNGYDIGVPNHLWKVIVVMDQPGQTIADVDENTMAFAIDIPNINPDDDAIDPDNWKDYVIPVQTLENRLGITKYDFLSNVSTEIQEKIENRDRDEILSWINDRELTSPLLAAPDTSIRHNSFVENNVLTTFNNQFPGSSQVSMTKIGVEETSFFKDSISKYGSAKIDFTESNLSEPGTSKVDPLHITVPKTTFVHTNSSEVSKAQVNFSKGSPIELGFAEVGFPVNSTLDTLVSQPPETLSSEIFFAPSVSSEQFVSIHNSTPKITNVLNNTATNIWSDLLQTETQLNVNFQITDLPKGQLAEATITGFNDSGVPNAGTIAIDHNANGVGWFIDPTPLNNSEFTPQNTDSYLLATAESEAEGKYDLLSTVLHELAHLYGFIDGYEGFDARVETEDGTTKFIGDDFERGSASRLPRQAQVSFEAVLDGEHLDKQAHPYDLLNTHLVPGIRKLPSELDVEILQALIATELEQNDSNPAGEELLASLTSDPLLAIANGDFSISDTTTDRFAWNTRGASGIEDGQAVLTEDSPFLSNFTQTFTVPESAKTIQFKLIGAELGASELAPPDAFEVALFDADTNESLTAVSDLSNTDSLLNIQNDGTTYFSDKVRIGGATSGEIIGLDRPRTVTVDISDLTPGSQATLYFDLLGFGDADSRVVIDDVRLSDQFLLPPVANDDTATVTQGETVEIDILANDTDDDGTLNPDSVQITTEPANGTATVNDDGTVSYTPGDRFVGEDSFTYVVQDNDEQQSETATVDITVENAIPEISEVQIPDTVTEGVEVSLNAIASDAGNDELTYVWEVDGQQLTENNPQINYTFPDNGTYTGSITVTDTHGGSNTQTFEVTVENAVPVVDAGSDITVDEGSNIEFAGSYSDTGANDTHTVSWDFGDGNEQLTVNSEQSTVEHTYIDDGEYTATYTVTDNDGATKSDTVEVTVNNVVPVIESITGDTEINEGDTATFNAIATDPGDDTITYIWDFGDGSEQLTVSNEQLPVSHVYADNGDYTVTLTVRDEDGGETVQTLDVRVNNVAPTFDAVNGATVVDEGEAVNYSAIASDPGDDELTYNWNFGDNTPEVAGTDVLKDTASHITHTFANNGIYDATVTVTDDDGDSTVDNLTITVSNVAPTVNTESSATGSEGSAVTFEATFDDPGNDDLTVTWDFGDGSDAVTTNYPAPSEVSAETQTHTYADNGTYTATVTITDSDGASTESEIEVAIANTAPVIETLIGDREVNEGDTVTFNAIASDAGDDELTYIWDFGDGSEQLAVSSEELPVEHIYRDNGDYTVTLTIRDEDGGETIQTLDVNVANVAPTFTEVNGETAVNEGEVVNYSATASDPGSDELTYTWSFDGGTSQVDMADVNHIFAQDGTYDATVTVTDDDGASISQTLNVTVNNVAPSIETDDSRTGDEGSFVEFNATISDPGTDALTITWDFGDGSDPVTTDYNESPTPYEATQSYTYTQNGVYTATVTVTDSDGATTESEVEVTVSNVVPVIESLTGDTEINEGDTATFNAIATDAGSDELTYSWDFGDGSEPLVVVDDANPVEHTYADNGDYTVTLTVRDSDGAEAVQTHEIAVNNTVPVITSLTGDPKVDEGDTASFSVSASDAGDDTLAYVWDFGDGSDTVMGENVEHIFADNGLYETTVTVTDDDGANITQSLTINLASDLVLDSAIEITDSVSIVSEGETIITQAGNDRLFEIDDGNSEELINVTLKSLTLTGGSTTDNGGAVFSTENLTLINSQISGNRADSSGGGIYQQGASLNIANSTLNNNSAKDSGGAIAVAQASQVKLVNATLSDNSANLGGGMASLDNTTQVKIIDSQVTDNGKTNITGSGFVFVTTQDTVAEDLDLAGDTVYRFFNSSLGGHFYTASEPEKNYVRDNLTNYQYEGESYRAANSQAESAESVYRFFNAQTGFHLYTTDEVEKDYISSNLDHFAYEGSVFSAYETQQTGSIPIYRFYEPTLGTHFYTDVETEMMSVRENLPNYNYEGIAYYALPTEDNVV